MRHLILNANEAHPVGWTDLFMVSHADLTDAVALEQQTVVLKTLGIGTVVSNVLLLEVKVVPAGLTTCVCSVGPAGINMLSAVDVVGTRYHVPAHNKGAYVIADAASQLVAIFKPNTGAESLSLLTAGEFWIWASCNRAADRRVEV